MTHTPGPWHYKTTPGSDHELCTVYSETTGKAVARHVTKEDAPAIAMLPELLEALEEIAAENMDDLSDRDELLRCAGIARSAIQKAEAQP